MNRHLLAVAVVVVTVFASSQAWATDYSWTGAAEGSNPRGWSNGGNWSPNGVPGPDDTATFAGALTYAVDVGVQGVRRLSVSPGVTLVDGTITIQGTASGPGVFDWSGGMLSALTVNIAAGATLNLTGGAEKTLDQSATINNVGTTVWTGGLFGGSAEAVFNNSGTFNAMFDGVLGYGAAGGPNTATFVNTGTFVKTAGSGAVVFKEAWGLHTTGIVRVNSGTLMLAGAGNSDHEFSQGARFEAGRTVIGSLGSTAQDAASVIGGTVTIATGATVEFGSGSELGGNGTFTGAGTVAWNGGRVVGDFGRNSVTIDSGLAFQIGGSDRKVMDQGAIIHNRGTATWSGTGDLVLGGSTIDNSGTFSAKSDALMTYNQAGTFTNSGTFTKEGSAGNTTIQDEFDNSGTVTVKSGTLLFDHAQYQTFVQSKGVLSLEGGSIVAREGQPGDARQGIEIQGGTVQGNGTIDADVNNSGGTFSPGVQGIGMLTVSGNYTQGSGAQLVVDVGPGGNDKLVVGGATLDGALNVRQQSGFTPTKDDSFQVLTFSSRQGSFASVTGTTLATNYRAGDVTIGSLTGGGGGGGGGCSSTPGLAWPLAVLVLGLGRVQRRKRQAAL